jgi:hypothetical protein
MQNFWYQVFHPWHWLTYGQNAGAVGAIASAVAAVAAVLALIGLFFYTQYTRRMMQMQEETAGAAIRPQLVMQGDVQINAATTEHTPEKMAEILYGPAKETLYEFVLRIRNVGEGAALFLTGWHQQVSAGFVNDGSALLETTGISQKGEFELTVLMKGESTSAAFYGINLSELGLRRVIVIETLDQANRRHQLQIGLTPLLDGVTEVSAMMVHQGERPHEIVR